MRNVLVCGKAGSGKDTVGDYLVDKYDYRRVSFAAPLKRIARELWPDLDWSQKNRDRLQSLGSKIRDIDVDTWVRLALVDVNKLNAAGHPAVITDCRYPNELEFFQYRSFLALRVEAPYSVRHNRLMERDGAVDEQALKHASETSLDGSVMDILDNSGSFLALYGQITNLLEQSAGQ